MLSIIADTFRIPTLWPPRSADRRKSPDRTEELRRLRSDLRDLDRHMLRDIGLDPDHAGAEERPTAWRWSAR